MLDSLKPYSDPSTEVPVRFWAVKPVSRFFRRSPSVFKTDECRKAFKSRRKYQYHRNQRLLASKGWKTATSAISLPDFKVA
jgi:hypothetical protein